MKFNQIVDISDWIQTDLKVIWGTRAKAVLKRTKMGKVYFMVKSYEKDIGELRSEVCASSIGRVFGFPVQKSWLCKIPQYKKLELKQPLGVLIQLDVRRSRDIRRNQFREDLKHASALISSINAEFGQEKTGRRRNLYTLTLVVEAIRNYVGKHKEATQIWKEFFELMTFDALIGGTDRHENNWGVLEKADDGKFLRLAPAFDNGISLLWSFEDYKPRFIKSMFSRDFIFNAKSLLKKDDGTKFTLFDILGPLYRVDEYKKTEIVREVLEKIKTVNDEDIRQSIFKSVPQNDDFHTGETELNYIFQYVKMRRDILLVVLNNIIGRY